MAKDCSSKTDVSKAEDCKATHRRNTCQTYGQIDTLVNNAGVNFVKPTLEMDEADWDRVVDVDLKGTFLCSRYALEADGSAPQRKHHQYRQRTHGGDIAGRRALRGL